MESCTFCTLNRTPVNVLGMNSALGLIAVDRGAAVAEVQCPVYLQSGHFLSFASVLRLSSSQIKEDGHILCSERVNEVRRSPSCRVPMNGQEAFLQK